MLNTDGVDLKVLIDALLNIENVPGNWWRKDCAFVAEERDGCKILVVWHVPSRRFLRHSKGPVQGHQWDIYGDNYHNAAWAILALSQAPAPSVVP